MRWNRVGLVIVGCCLCSFTPSDAFSLQTTARLDGQKIAVVTGANKGIGKEIARKLGPNFTTILACRNRALGTAAADELLAAGSDVIFHPFDLTDTQSAQDLAEFVGKEYGRLDVLVNNAAICFNDPTLYGKVPHTPFKEQANITVRTNFFGTLALTQQLLPYLRESRSPRIVIVASAAGRLSILRSQEKVDLFTSPNLQIAELEDAMRQFVQDVHTGVHTERGWPNTCYGTSKLGLIALTRVLARREPRMSINSVDPGYCATDQNANQGTRSAELGSGTAVALATIEEAECISGQHFFDGKEISWWYK